jgi:hypothetical protein
MLFWMDRPQRRAGKVLPAAMPDNRAVSPGSLPARVLKPPATVCCIQQRTIRGRCPPPNLPAQ